MLPSGRCRCRLKYTCRRVHDLWGSHQRARGEAGAADTWSAPCALGLGPHPRGARGDAYRLWGGAHASPFWQEGTSSGMQPPRQPRGGGLATAPPAGPTVPVTGLLDVDRASSRTFRMRGPSVPPGCSTADAVRCPHSGLRGIFGPEGRQAQQASPSSVGLM